MIAEAEEDAAQGEKEKQITREKIYELEGNMEHYAGWGEEAFEYARQIFALAVGCYSESEIRDMAQGWYRSFEYTDQDDDGQYVVQNRSFENFQKLYEITGILPDESFVQSDIATPEGLDNALNHVARILFFRSVSSPQAAGQYEHVDDVFSKGEQQLTHDLIAGSNSPAKIEAVYGGLLSHADAGRSHFHRLKTARHLKYLFPEMRLTADVKVAERLYADVIAEAVSNRARGGRPDTDRNNDDCGLMEDIELAREATGVSLQNIQFDRSVVTAWYDQLIPVFIKQFSYYPFEGFFPTIVTIERITQIRPDFSAYKPDIKNILRAETQALEDDEAHAALRRQTKSNFVDHYTRIRELERFTGIRSDLDAERVRTLGHAELLRYVGDLFSNMMDSALFGSYTLKEAQRCFDHIQKIGQACGVYADPAPEQIRGACLNIVGEMLKGYGGTNRMRAASEYLGMMEHLTGKSRSELIAEPEKKALFDSIVREYEYCLGNIKMWTVLTKMEELLKSKPVFSDNARRSCFSKDIVSNDHLKYFVLHGIGKDVNEFLGPWTEEDTQWLYTECFTRLSFPECIEIAYKIYGKTNFQPEPAVCVMALIENPEMADVMQNLSRNMRSVYKGNVDAGMPLDGAGGRFLQNFSHACKKDRWFQTVAGLQKRESHGAWRNGAGALLKDALEAGAVSARDGNDIDIVRHFLKDIGVVDNAKLLAIYRKRSLKNNFEQSDPDGEDETFIARFIENNFDQKKSWPMLARIIKKFHCGIETIVRKIHAHVIWSPTHAIEVARAFNVQKKHLRDKTMQRDVARAALDVSVMGESAVAADLMDIFSLSPEAIKDAARDRLFDFRRVHGKSAESINKETAVYKELGQITPEVMRDDVRQRDACRFLQELFIAKQNAEAQKFVNDFWLSGEEVMEVVTSGVLQCLAYDDAIAALDIKKAFRIPAESFHNERDMPVVTQCLRSVFFQPDGVALAVRLRDEFAIPEAIAADIARSAIVQCFRQKRGAMSDVPVSIKTAFGLGDDMFTDETSRAAASGYFEWLLSRAENLHAAQTVQKNFGIHPETARAMAITAVMDALEGRNILHAGRIKQEFALSAEAFADEWARSVVLKAITLLLGNAFEDDHINIALQTCHEYGLPKEQATGAALQVSLDKINSNQVNRAATIKRVFQLPAESFQTEFARTSITTAIGKYFESGKIEDALLCISEFFESANAADTVFVKTLTSASQKQLLANPRFIEKIESAMARTPFLKDVFESDPCVNAFSRIRRIQQINKNEANDPWKKEFQPFLADPAVKGLISVERAEDAQLLVDFVKYYGMMNLPILFRLHAVCTRAKTWEEIPEDILALFERYGIRARKNDVEKTWRFPTPKSLLNELGKTVRAFQTELMSDRVPNNILSEIGREQFVRLVGHTQQWKRGHTLDGLVALWEKTLEKDPEAGRLPTGYQEAQFAVAELTIKTPTHAREENKQERIDELLASKEMHEQYAPLADAVKIGIHADTDHGYWLENQRSLLVSLQAQIDEVQGLLSASPEELDARITNEPDEQRKMLLAKKKKALGNERGRAGMAKQRDTLFETLQKAEQLSFVFADEPALVDTLEILAELAATMPEAVRVLREASAAHIMRVAPEGWRETLITAFKEDALPSADRVQALRSFSREYLREHYLHETQAPDHTGHVAFSPALRVALGRAWQQQESAKGKMPIEAIADKIQRIMNPVDDEGKQNQIGVSMVPVAGLLRIYSGDVGDACYTSLHEALAENKYRKIHAWLYVTGRGATQETLRGSMLGIQATRDDGVATLVARANNPQENFIQSVEADSFVLSSLSEVIATARRMRAEGKRQAVAIPLDSATQSSTNRTPVASAYKKRFGTLPKIGLKNEPDTNFNGYDIWSKGGAYACGTIWEMDEEGNEIWHGDWSKKGDK